MKRRITGLMAIVLVLAMLAGCGSNNYSAREPGYAEQYSYEGSYVTADMAEGAVPASMSAKNANASGPDLPQGRKWIITMNLQAETDDLDTALDAINAQIGAMNGYVESQSINNSSSYRRTRSAYMTVRIPAENVDAFVSEVNGIANVTSNSRNVRDITLAYTDTEGRVNALKAEEKRLLELMERAESMSDLLEIEGRLTDVRYELESYSSQLRLYDNQIDYATVDLNLTEVQKYTPVEEPGFWKRISDGLGDSIVDLGETIVNAIAVFIIDLPYIIVLCLLGWGAVTLIKRSLKKRKVKKEPKEEKK